MINNHGGQRRAPDRITPITPILRSVIADCLGDRVVDMRADAYRDCVQVLG